MLNSKDKTVTNMKACMLLIKLYHDLYIFPGKIFQKKLLLVQIAREKSCDYLLIIYTKNITTTTNFDSARVFSSFK